MSSKNRHALLEAPTPQSPPAARSDKISYEEFLARDFEGRLAEWVDGEVITMTVSSEHQELTIFLTALLRFYAEAHESGRVFGEPFQMKTSPELPGRSPDLFFVATKRLSKLKKHYFDGPADLVIEVISPESRARDRGEKFYEYEQGGVKEYWLIDPQRRQAEFYQRSRKGIYQVVQPDAAGRYHSAVLKGLWIRTDWLWQEPLPPLVKILKEWGLV
ncbi:MAG TPA: Uma2 family endonuclease [Blastocatellia bacterium]|nr:Uma2 family endonuclease [Blastocatellia bacterium]